MDGLQGLRILKKQRTWAATKGGTYTIQARRLARRLSQAGCAEEKVTFAISACAEAFGIIVTRNISRRTVRRAKKEGGIYGLMQLGREIHQADGFGKSSDGTSHRKTTYESVHACVLAPTYAPDADDSDRSTWTQQLRFVDVSPAVDHTAQSQFENGQHLAARIMKTYSDSPLASRDGATMETDDYIRKQIFQNMDHAADGKKKFALNGEWKKAVLFKDLGLKEMETMDLDDVLKLLVSLTEEEIAEAQADAAKLNPAKDKLTAMNVLEIKLGSEIFNKMTSVQQGLVYLWVFGGCCGHKDLNAFRYGVVKMTAGWELWKRPAPVLLANKANDAVIRLGENADSAAVQRAVDSSTRGGVKLGSLSGALFNHKSEGQGYQDVHRHFMSKRKRELHDIHDHTRFPDTSNTRYQSHSYASAELTKFLDLYVELVEEVWDSKAKVGLNHLEENVAKGLEDPSTVTELAAMALYGCSVSWPYLREARGPGGKIINLLDLGNLHRRLPIFCDRVSANPRLLLDLDGSLELKTIDGKPWIDPHLVTAIRVMSSELPDLEGAISDMFSGAVEGWRRFTPEFVVPGGTFDLLTPEQRGRLFIPSTNDANEGGLGSWRVHVWYHPSSTAASFSSQARHTRNNTDGFVNKLCDHADHLYVMQQARLEDASGKSSKFRKHLLAAQYNHAEKARQKQIAMAQKKQTELARLANVGLILNRPQVKRMTIPQLDDQLSIHRKILNDVILLKVLQKDLKNRAFKLSAVLAAITRNEAQIMLLHALITRNGDHADLSSVDSDNAGMIDIGAGSVEEPLDAEDNEIGEDYMEDDDEYYDAPR
ncbi:hypothetical protein Hypma_000601 [Hypsizygus marmoreus]|uniref:Uncharacterized protein n=1 Tax=Hypsizygus marmoreus TaxID=39966 RepID=A0A369JAK7_HYPMA|nr:hypothetical protein Hypma_000601 [Hypsizygus marmoreus]